MSAYPDKFRTLDSDAFGKGEQWSAYRAKALELMRLRLRNKEQGLFTVGWPIVSGFDGARSYTFLPADAWVRVVDPQAVGKCRVAGHAYCVASFISDNDFLLQFCTKARPFDQSINAQAPSGVGLQQIGSTSGSPDLTARVLVPVLAGVDEEVSVFARAKVGSQSLTMLGLTVTALRQMDWHD